MACADLRLGRWEDVLADVRPDAVITDPPYGARTHVGALGADDGRADIDYAHWTPTDVAAFVASWAPRTSSWVVAMTSHDLVRHWLAAYEHAGWYAFAPVAAVVTGMGFRRQGDGPASWTIHICVGRRRAKHLSTVAGAKGIWRALPGGYTGPATPGMTGGRGKPAWLVEALVRDYSDPGMVVCDPCAGYGGTLVAATKLGRQAVGAEMDDDAHHLASRTLRGLAPRVDATQGDLFATTASQEAT